MRALILVRSRALRIDSMYASERAEIQKAYEIDPTDPDIQSAWSSMVSPAKEIAGTQAVAGHDEGSRCRTRQKAEGTVHR